jgi:RsiW-degrading membrane proteinase PrsW (M82 family)
VPGAAAATLIEFVLGIVFFILCFGAQAAREAPAASAPGGSSDEPPGGDSGGGGGAPFPGISTHSFAFVAYLFLTAYLTAALVEESVKAALVRCQSCLTGCCGPERACCLQRPHPDPRRQAFMTIALLLAASVGFSSMENLIYVLESGVGVPAGQALGERALLALMRGAVSMPVHAACGAFTGLRLTIRDAQRRRRDGAVLAAVGAAGAPQMVMLASGVVVQVVAAAQPPHDAAALQGVGLVAAQGAAPVAAQAAREAVVWSWPRVLWPAIAIHGTFDFAMLLFDTLVEDEAGSLAGVIVAALVVMLASGWALRSQLGAVLAVTARGEVPERVTFSPVWWPECLRALLPRAAAGEGGGYDSVLDHAPGAAESMLGPEAEGVSARERERARRWAGAEERGREGVARGARKRGRERAGGSAHSRLRCALSS